MKKILSFLLLGLLLSIGNAWGTLPENPTWVATSLDDIADGATLIIISNSTVTTNIALPSTTTTSNPAKKACTISTTDGVSTITPPNGTTLQDLAWTLEKKTSTYKFFQEGSTTIRLYLTGLSSNTALRVGNATSSNDEFAMGNSGKLLKVSTGNRFVGPNDNNGTDWRTYNSETATNYKGAALTFYVLATSGDTQDPTVTGVPASIDFGNVLKDATGISNKTFTITGTNMTADLTLAATGDFTVTPTGTIAQSEGSISQEVTISAASTTTTGEKSGTITISGDDLENDIVVNISMNVVEPMSVAEARAAIDANAGITGVYATGVVSEIVTPYGQNNYTNITFDIIDEGGSNTLRVYRCVSSEDADASQVAVGDVVVVSGNLTLYNSSVYEFAQGCVLVSLQHPAATICANPEFSPAGGEFTSAQSVTITCATEGATIHYTTDGTDPTASSTAYTEAIAVNTTTTIKAIAVKDGLDNSAVVSATYTIDLTPVINAENPAKLAYDATSGEIDYTITNPLQATALTANCTAEWISDITVTADKVTFTTTANEGNEDRVATITLSYLQADDKEITVTQGHFVVDYATLPFEFDGGKNGISSTTGLTQDGLGTDYGSSPYLKFDGSNDYVILKINERPGTLSFDLKGNSFSGGTFKVQTSADGETYTDLESYTELGNTQSEKFTTLGENVRYIKWIYVSKSSGNVALGNIALAKYVAPSADPSITVSSNLVEAPAAGADGTIEVTYNNITTIAAEVNFYESDGTTSTTYDWIQAEIDENNDVYYVIEANTGDARTAYLKVYALDDEANDVYSELITISQAAYVAPAAPSAYFTKVTATADIIDGEYLIVYEDGAVAFDGSQTTLDDSNNTIDVEIEEGKIVADDATLASIFTIDVTNGTLQSKSGKYIGVNSNSNGLKTEDTPSSYTNSFSIDEGNDAIISAVFEESTMTLRYNSASNQARFRYYKSGQQDIQLYKSPFSIKLNSYGYATYCSPKPLDFTNASGYTAWYVSDVTDNVITFSQITGTIEGGQGILLKGLQNAGITLTPAESSANVLTDNMLVGCVVAKTVNDAPNYYVLSGNQFMNLDDWNGTIPAGKAYLDLAGLSLAPGALRIAFAENNTTDVKAIEASETAVKFFENGQLFILRDGVVYDAMGKMVR